MTTASVLLLVFGTLALMLLVGVTIAAFTAAVRSK